MLFRKKYNKLSFFVYNLDHSFTKPTRMPNSFVHVTDTAIHESNIATHIPIKYLYIITNVYYNLATKNSKYWAYATSNDQPIYIQKIPQLKVVIPSIECVPQATINQFTSKKIPQPKAISEVCTKHRLMPIEHAQVATTNSSQLPSTNTHPKNVPRPQQCSKCAPNLSCWHLQQLEERVRHR